MTRFFLCLLLSVFAAQASSPLELSEADQALLRHLVAQHQAEHARKAFVEEEQLRVAALRYGLGPHVLCPVPVRPLPLAFEEECPVEQSSKKMRWNVEAPPFVPGK